MITLNNLIARIETFAQSHEQIKTWYLGDPWDQLSGGTSITYPMLFGVLKNAQVQSTSEVTEIEFFICDKPAKGNPQMLLEMLSDTKLMALDFISYCSALNVSFGSATSMTIEKNITLEDFNEAFDDEICGWRFSLKFKQPFMYDLCTVPIN